MQHFETWHDAREAPTNGHHPPSTPRPEGRAVIQQQSTVTPAGDTINVLTDDDVVRALGSSRSQALGQALSLNGKGVGERRAIVESLWRDGLVGPDRSGLATAILAERAGGIPTKVVSSILSAPIMRLVIAAERNGKRTYSMRLAAVPERWLPHLEQIAPAVDPPPVDPVPVPAPLDGPATVDAGAGTTAEDPGPVVEGRIADAVATALLAQVVEIISTRDSAAPALGKLELDVMALQERLGTQVEYVDRLRRDLRLTGDELAAVKTERDGLRQRLRAAEHNLKVATSADARRIIDEEVRRRLADVMRETPIGPASRVESSGTGR